MDQDSVLVENYVKKILKLLNNNKNVVAISPNLFDRNKKTELGLVKRFLFFKININSKFNEKKNILNMQNENPKTEYITETMSSGTMIKLNSIPTIGYMNDDLFLDWVDFEWCWRVRKYKKYILGLPSIFALHNLGSSTVKFFNKTYHIHNLLRYCYIVRNGIALSLYSQALPFFWRINVFFNTIRYFFGAIILNKFNPKEIFFLFSSLISGFLYRRGQIKIYKKNFNIRK